MARVLAALHGKDTKGQDISGGSAVVAVVVAAMDIADGPVPEGSILRAWHRATFADEAASAAYHLEKHGGGRTLAAYTNDATEFFKANSGRGVAMTAKDGSAALRIKTPGGGPGGIFTPEGKIITFWYR